jgi:hypothetical protein
MHHDLMSSTWGNIAIVAVAGTVTAACFIAMLWMLVRPGETDRRHRKYAILRDDR